MNKFFTTVPIHQADEAARAAWPRSPFVLSPSVGAWLQAAPKTARLRLTELAAQELHDQTPMEPKRAMEIGNIMERISLSSEVVWAPTFQKQVLAAQ